eukprot:CAMPEP_0114560642 /NCGR_PEP_ID=MMETSP0114-20121206/11566_1 /TAXON_ID=31324 /ORGANISM="Goniomonas sp, Strain m" /LENGTH=70 /DNA_ID=CAMNT_0001746197 /DNA_START=666 /DNA_END=878 /DNA_ORIENTATION=+
MITHAKRHGVRCRVWAATWSRWENRDAERHERLVLNIVYMVGRWAALRIDGRAIYFVREINGLSSKKSAV